MNHSTRLPLIKVIVGSTRPNRFGLQPAQWLMRLAKAQKDARFELIDLAEVKLPLLDEPMPPIMANYANEHSKAWSAVIGEADGFIFVTPEYNHSIPAALKNAVDFLNHEWRYKPAAFISYGGAVGGTRAVEHLRSTLAVFNMYDLEDQVTIPNYWKRLDKAGMFVPSEGQQSVARELLKNIIFWASQMHEARKALSANQFLKTNVAS